MSESSRHDLDELIDRVAAKMVAVDADAGTLRRVLTQLPERVTTPWFLSVRVQLAAAAVMVVVAFLYARPSRKMTSIAALPVAEPAVVAGLRPVEVSPQLVAVPIPDPRLRQGYGGPARMSAGTVERPDHERSLPPVSAVEALELDGIAPSPIDVESAAAIAPLVLTELALEPEGEE